MRDDSSKEGWFFDARCQDPFPVSFLVRVQRGEGFVGRKDARRFRRSFESRIASSFEWTSLRTRTCMELISITTNRSILHWNNVRTCLQICSNESDCAIFHSSFTFNRISNKVKRSTHLRLEILVKNSFYPTRIRRADSKKIETTNILSCYNNLPMDDSFDKLVDNLVAHR